MKLEEVLEFANRTPGEHTERDVIDFFRRHNVGHWPSEPGIINIAMEDAPLVATIDRKGVTFKGHTISPAGKIWLINQFFKQFKPLIIKDTDKLIPVVGKTPLTAIQFRQRISERMKGRAKFLKDGKNRIAFTERKRVHVDGSMMITFDFMDLDTNKVSHVVIVPGVKPVTYIYQEKDGNVVRFQKNTVSGNELEHLADWELAAAASAWRSGAFTIQQPVHQEMLDRVLELTKDDEKTLVEKSHATKTDNAVAGTIV